MNPKEKLRELTLLAIDRFEHGKSFTWNEANAYFRAIAETFGENEASGFLNLVLDTIHNNYAGTETPVSVLVPLAVVETIATAVKKKRVA